jgi:phosphoglycerate dehydrogenase-like enzyme
MRGALKVGRSFEPVAVVGNRTAACHKQAMKVVVRIENEVSAFRLDERQFAGLVARYPELTFVRPASPAAFLQELETAVGALVWHFDASWYARAPLLELVATPAAGRERVAPDPSGRVTPVHGAFHGKLMAETLVGMVTFWARRFDLAEAQQCERRFERDPFSSTRRLAGQTALVVGYGALGRHCAASLKALGLRVIGVRRHASGEAAPADELRPASELSSLLGRADHVVVTLPGDTGADRLFDARAFAAMRSDAYFYNLGRGNVVDERALVTALEAQTIAGAFLDVFAEEPLPRTSPLWQAPRLRLLPHASAVAREYLELWLEELAPELARLAARGGRART